MQLHNNRSGRSSVRLGLESLESRTLPSASLPGLALDVGHTAGHQAAASPVAIQYVTNHAAVWAPYAYHWSVVTTAFFTGSNPTTGNHKSTGSVDFALVRDGFGSVQVNGSAAVIPAFLVSTTSSASPRVPDTYNHVPFSVRLTLRNLPSGQSTTLTFTGTLNGTLTWKWANLTATFNGPLTRQVYLGGHSYTLTLPGGPIYLPAPGMAPARIGITIRATH
jgi:hypothetical protein